MALKRAWKLYPQTLESGAKARCLPGVMRGKTVTQEKLEQQAVSRQGLQIHSANTRGKLTDNNNKSNFHHNNMHKGSEIRNPGRDTHEIPFRDLGRLK